MKTKPYIQASMLCSISLLFSLFNQLTSGIMDIFLGYLFVFPMSYYHYLYGYKYSSLLFISIAIGNLLFGNIYFYSILIYSVIIGINIGIHFRNKYDYTYLFVSTCILSIIYNCIIVEILSKLLMIPIDVNTNIFINYPYIGNIYQYLGINVIVNTFICIGETITILFINQFFYQRFHLSINKKINRKVIYIIFLLCLLLSFIPNILGKYAFTFLFILICIDACMHFNKYRYILLWIILIPYLNLLLGMIGCLFIFNDIIKDIVYNKRRKEG